MKVSKTTHLKSLVFSLIDIKNIFHKKQIVS